MDIKLNIKGLSVIRGQIKVDDIDVGFSCTEGETANCNECSLELLDNPAIQGLIKKFTEEVNFKPAQPQQKTAANITELCGKVNEVLTAIKKEREANAKCRQQERELCERISRRMADIAERTQKF